MLLATVCAVGAGAGTAAGQAAALCGWCDPSMSHGETSWDRRERSAMVRMLGEAAAGDEMQFGACLIEGAAGDGSGGCGACRCDWCGGRA